MAKGTILIAGGAGFIGSQVAKKLHIAGYDTVVYDNLSRGNKDNVIYGTLIEADLADKAQLRAAFKKYQFDAAMHFSALIDVGESVKDPLKYYYNNVSLTVNLLEVLVAANIESFIFSSSAAIFGLPQTETISEDHPKNPINPYGKTKLMVEQILADLGKATKLRYSCLRYFNAAGGDPEGLIKYKEREETNLIPKALKSLKDHIPLTIFGDTYPTLDGTCVRDYIHIDDLADAHIKAMERLLSDKPSENFNLGNGLGYTVKEVLQAVESVSGEKLKVKIGPMREGDPPKLVANSSKAFSDLGWQPKFPLLETIVNDAFLARK